MPLPAALQALFDDMQRIRQEILKEIADLSQEQFDWRPGPDDWSIGEIVHHLSLADIASGKLTTKLLRQAESSGQLAPYPSDAETDVPVRLPKRERPGPVMAPPFLWPKHGRPASDVLDELRAMRERARQSIERLAAVDPRPLRWTHFALGELNVVQAWAVILANDGQHLQQIRTVKASPGFPRPQLPR